LAPITPRTARIPQADAAVVAVLPGNPSLLYFDTHAALTAGARGDPEASESLADDARGQCSGTNSKPFVGALIRSPHLPTDTAACISRYVGAHPRGGARCYAAVAAERRILAQPAAARARRQAGRHIGHSATSWHPPGAPASWRPLPTHASAGAAASGSGRQYEPLKNQWSAPAKVLLFQA
jgi:hypothetical protein